MLTLARLRDAVAGFYDRLPPTDPFSWHRWNVLLRPVTSIDGTLLIGRVWRRRRDDAWEYQENPETLNEFSERQY